MNVVLTIVIILALFSFGFNGCEYTKEGCEAAKAVDEPIEFIEVNKNET